MLETFEVNHLGAKASLTDSQNTCVYVSDEWTFEYCLIRSGLAEEIYEVVKRETDPEYADLPEDSELKAIKIYGLIESSNLKTELAYRLSQKIIHNYSDEDGRNRLLGKLPAYIKSAVGYVTEPFAPSPAVSATSGIVTPGAGGAPIA